MNFGIVSVLLPRPAQEVAAPASPSKNQAPDFSEARLSRHGVHPPAAISIYTIASIAAVNECPRHPRTQSHRRIISAACPASARGDEGHRTCEVRGHYAAAPGGREVVKAHMKEAAN